MPALQGLIDGFLTAAEVATLLLVAPVAATERSRIEPASTAPAIERMRDLHLLSSSFDVRLLGLLADVRVSRLYRNNGAETINLAGRLPAVDEHTDALRIHRRGRSVDLLDSGCGGDDDSDEDAGLQASLAGHVRLAVDESIADALQLAPGATASIELIATHSLSRSGAVFRLALPDREAVEPQALLVDQADVRFLVVVPHRATRGVARLTLRPDQAASETIELGALNDSSTVYVVPLANRAALQALVTGAIELETRTIEGIVWSTLPPQLRTDATHAAVTSK
jgi:hypothetical protein